VLTSAKNPKVVAAVRLKKRALREEEQRFLVEGAQAVGEALAEEDRLRSLFVTDELDPLAVRARERRVPVEEVSPRVMERLTSTVTPQGIVGVASFVDVPIASVGSEGSVAVLHEVRDPGNAGTILRSAEAAGAGAVLFTGTCVDPTNPKAVRASAGSLFHVGVVSGGEAVDVLAQLGRRGLRRLGADARASDPLDTVDLTTPVALVLGNEAHGLPPEIDAVLDGRVTIPMAGRAESLNVGMAAAVLTFEVARQRRQATPA
jgi:TrmH family RNA methyltransferase